MRSKYFPLVRQLVQLFDKFFYKSLVYGAERNPPGWLNI